MLVTGASGYVATHCVKQLLLAGYRVRGSVRSRKNERKVRLFSVCLNTVMNFFCSAHIVRPLFQVSPLLRLPHAKERLELVEADLLNEDDWPR